MPRLRLPIHDPCHEDWAAMDDQGDGRRFCDQCTKNVHDVSSMTEREARAMLRIEQAKGRVCVRYRTDVAGNIKFRAETVQASSSWRSMLAAAGMAVMMLSGCTSGQPDEVLDDKCVYEVGPWSVELARGEGTCPAAEIEVEPVLMGEPAVVLDPTEPDPEAEMGELVEPEPEPEPEMGALVEPAPEPKHAKMGKVALPPDPEPEPIHELKGEIEALPEPEMIKMGDIAPTDEPCDPLAPDSPGPRRL